MPLEPLPVSRGRSGLWLPAIFLVLGLLITAAAVHQTLRFIEQEQQAAFNAEASRLRNDFALHTYRHIDLLRTYQAEFSAHPYFFDDAFKRMAQVLNVYERLPGIDSLGYVRYQPGPQDEYMVRFLYEPNAPSLDGRRLPSDPVLLEALERARDIGDIAATAPFLSARGTGHKVFAVFLPLYRGGLTPIPLDKRRKDFEGAMLIVMHPTPLIESLFEDQMTPDARIRLRFEGYADSNLLDAVPATLYDNLERIDETVALANKHLPFMLAGTRWSLELGSQGAEARSQRWLPWAILAVGMLLSLLSAMVVLILLRSRTLSLQRATEDRGRRRKAEAALHLRQRAIEASANAIVIASATRPGYPVEYVNPAFERMTGYSADEVLGQSLRIMHGLDTDQEGLTELKNILAERREGQTTLRNYHKDGQLYWTRIHIAPVRDDSGEVTHFVAAKYDITQMLRYQETLEFQAWHDALTQLPNRHALRARLMDAIVATRPGDTPSWIWTTSSS